MRFIREKLTNLEGNNFSLRLKKSAVPLHSFIKALGCEDFYWEDKTVFVAGHRPDVAKFAYDVSLFPALEKTTLISFCEREKLKCPNDYLEFLTLFNGAELTEMSLYGVPPSTLGTPSTIDRTSRNPLCLLSANRHWKYDFQGPKGDDFLFASRDTGWATQRHYLIKADNSVVSFETSDNHESRDAATWLSFKEWLSTELEQTLKDHEKFIAEVCLETETMKTPWRKLKAKISLFKNRR